MHGPNGSADEHEIVRAPVTVLNRPKRPRLSQKQVKELLAQLAIPFDPAVIQWKIVETRRVSGKWQGRVIPYADKLAYVHRLTELFTPVGWTANVAVHPAIMAPGDRGQRTTAKIVVTCHLTIHGINSHSSTGEEWADVPNAATSAEAQAFKRASANFGLGLYLYSFFRGRWVLLDSNKQIVSPPPLPDWATPAGWLAGARPEIERIEPSLDSPPGAVDSNVIREIEAMQHELGSHVYRKILRPHRVFFPKDIPDPATADKILTEMKLAASLMLRAGQATDRIGKGVAYEIVRSFNLRSLDDFSDLALLERLVIALEERGKTLETP
jgi:hypothetical protein